MTSKSSISNSSGTSLEEQRRRFESTQLKLQMLSLKTEEIQIDDYIKKLALDTAFVTNRTDVKPKLRESSFADTDVSQTGNQLYHWGAVSNQSSGTFSSEPVGDNHSHLLDLPDVGYLNPASSLPVTPTKPSWLMNISSLPPIYGEAIRAATTNHGLDSSVIYEIFRSSNLSTEVLYHIWSLTSCTQPGWFTPTELVTALALIGLAQRRQWEVHSASISEAISIHSVYEQICPPVPMIKIPNNSNRQSNSTGIALGSKSISQATVGNDFQNSVVSEFSKFPFQPPVVAFSAFPQQLDISNTSQNQSVQSDSKTNSFMDFTSSTSPIVDDPEWSDFTSFSASVAPLEKDTLMNVPVIVNGQKTPVTNVNNTLFDEEFGEFQTSHSIDSLKPIEFPNAFTHSNSLLPSSNNHAPKSSSSSSTEKIISYDLDPINIQCETNSSESLRGQWLCCLNMCLKVFNQSISVLSSLETPKDRKEFAESEEGSDFLLDITEIYLMTRRINLSARKYSILNPSMQQEFSDVENSFRKLASYAVTSDLKSKIDQALKSITILESENMIQDFMNASSPYCGVCLSSINPTDGQCINNPVNESSISSSSSSASPSPLQHANGHKRQKHLNHCLAHINLAGCYYHIPCANFWMNCVELCLPALKLPSVCI